MNKPVAPNAGRRETDQFFSAADMRHDRWRELNVAAHAWAAGGPDSGAAQKRVQALLSEIAPVEEFWAYPGPEFMRTLKDAINGGNAAVAAHLAQKIGRALLSRSYRSEGSAWDATDDSSPQGGNPSRGASRRVRSRGETRLPTAWCSAAQAGSSRAALRPEGSAGHERNR